MDQCKKTVGDNIRELLKGRPDLTQGDLAEKCGKTDGVVTNWIKGRNLPEAESLEVIASTFGCRIYQLFIPWPEWGGPKPAEISPDLALRIYLKSIGYTVSGIKKTRKRDPKSVK